MFPAFKAACQIYERPDYFPSREEDPDEYSEAQGYNDYGFDDDFDEVDEVDFDANDYRGSEIYLMSEGRLRKELRTRDRKWLIYRTPYRPETKEELLRPLSYE